jgi:hypothetical protein
LAAPRHACAPIIKSLAPAPPPAPIKINLVQLQPYPECKVLLKVMVSRSDFFESAEAVLERKLLKNPNYPFQFLCNDEQGNSVYVHSKRLPYFYFALCGCFGSILGLAIWVLAGAETVWGITFACLQNDNLLNFHWWSFTKYYCVVTPPPFHLSLASHNLSERGSGSLQWSGLKHSGVTHVLSIAHNALWLMGTRANQAIAKYQTLFPRGCGLQDYLHPTPQHHKQSYT